MFEFYVLFAKDYSPTGTVLCLLFTINLHTVLLYYVASTQKEVTLCKVLTKTISMTIDANQLFSNNAHLYSKSNNYD